MTTLKPRRNIVPRPDGIRVNVARFRGQLFVCADGCCCGRTEDGFAPVPAELYHEEWDRRRLRNFVHLTIGGCLGPCALANVVLLLFDGRAVWLHSISTDAQVTALYDHLEAMLGIDADAAAALPLPAGLAEFEFTASSWQDRPDGQNLDDQREWRVHREMPAPGGPNIETPAASPDRDENAPRSCPLPPAHACDVPPPDDAEEDRIDLAPVEPTIARMQGLAAIPRKNGELVFDAPWQGRAFGMTTALHEDGRYDWDAFRDKLIARVAVETTRQNLAVSEKAASEVAEPFDYYACWLGAFEALLAEEGIVDTGELDERAAEIEFGERDDVF